VQRQLVGVGGKLDISIYNAALASSVWVSAPYLSVEIIQDMKIENIPLNSLSYEIIAKLSILSDDVLFAAEKKEDDKEENEERSNFLDHLKCKAHLTEEDVGILNKRIIARRNRLRNGPETQEFMDETMIHSGMIAALSLYIYIY
jgi:hypothetical protein